VTSYEILTALGLDWFGRRGVGWAVLEVGLGGRLDATNVVTPDVAVITPISYDHMHILGRTLPEIAAEKAGIIKPGGLVVSAPQRPSARRVIRRVSEARGAEVRTVGGPGAPRVSRVDHLTIAADAPALPGEPFFCVDVDSARRSYAGLEVYLGGQHQIVNLLTALTALESAEGRGLELDAQAVARGVAATRWPGRLEVLRTAPLVVLDGAHNDDSARRLREALRLHFEFDRLHLVLGVFADKDLGAILRELRDWDTLTAVQADSPRARPAAEVAEAAGRPSLVRQAASVEEGLTTVISAAGRRDLVCVTGSLAVVAEAREALGLAVRESTPTPAPPP
jgi:dihydrofolate synthase/folylpolyglutamate synthase